MAILTMLEPMVCHCHSQANLSSHTHKGTLAEDDSTPKAKSAPKKANSKAKTVKNVEAPVDSTDTPTTSPAKKAGGKRKAAVFDDAEKGDEANGESAQKPKRKYIRKPKAADAPPAKRGKKGTKAGAETSEEESKVHVKAGSEELDQSAVLDDIIKHEEQNDEDQPFTAEEQEYVNGQLADDAILGAHANDDGIAL